MSSTASASRHLSNVTDDESKSYPRKLWNVADPDPAAARDLAGKLGISPILGQLLLNRGFSSGDLDAARQFLQPKLADLFDPATLPGATDAAERIARAIKDQQKSVIYGDYDVDGITATSILWHALVLLARENGGDPDLVKTYVPHRTDEGYGLGTDAVKHLAGSGTDLIITVDCGITACEQATLCKSLGVDLIVTDHHEWHLDGDTPVLPTDCCAIVHPRLPGGDYGNGDLVGAGVAMKLAWQVGKAVTGRPRVSEAMRLYLMDALALAAMGTVADVATLLGENRIIVGFGLGAMQKSKMPGLRALIDSAGLGDTELDSYHIGFLLGPRLNACGRLGHAQEAVDMLTVHSPGEARETADEFEAQNKKRQAIERDIVEKAVEQVRDAGYDEQPAIVVAGDDWHAGVVGIVASRLVDTFHRPTVVLSRDGDTLSGSARSIKGFHLAHALADCTGHLTKHGGHAMAAGLKLPAGNLDAFRAAFAKVAASQLTATDLVPSLRVDAQINLADVDESLVRSLERLGPFGIGNPKPMLCLRGVTVLTARPVGKTGDHLSLQLDASGRKTIKAIAFGCGDLAHDLRGGDQIDLAAQPQLNQWNGRTSVELLVKDLTLPTRLQR